MTISANKETKTFEIKQILDDHLQKSYLTEKVE